MTRTEQSLPLLRELNQKNPSWFDPKNKRFFGDIRYSAYYGKKTGERYLIQLTTAWTDMFDRKPEKHYRINYINNDLTIGRLVDTIFSNLEDVKSWLRNN